MGLIGMITTTTGTGDNQSSHNISVTFHLTLDSTTLSTRACAIPSGQMDQTAGVDLLCALSRPALLLLHPWCHVERVCSVICNILASCIHLYLINRSCIVFQFRMPGMMMLPTILDVFLLALTVMKTYHNAILLKGAFKSSLVCRMSLNSGFSFDIFFLKMFTLLRDGIL